MHQLDNHIKGKYGIITRVQIKVNNNNNIHIVHNLIVGPCWQQRLLTTK